MIERARKRLSRGPERISGLAPCNIGCPHQEGIDYEGVTCPACPFCAGRDRWTGKRLH